MNEFWVSDLGAITGDAADAFAKSFTTVPDGTAALARIESFVNDTNKDGFKCIVVNWELTAGDFKGAKVTQKIKVFGGEPQYDKDPAKTRHRALNMLKLLYQLYGISPKSSGAPTDQDLAVFNGKVAGIKIRETEPNNEGKTFNWVSEVHPEKGFTCETGVKMEVTHKNVSHGDLHDNAFARNSASAKDIAALADDIPF